MSISAYHIPRPQPEPLNKNTDFALSIHFDTQFLVALKSMCDPVTVLHMTYTYTWTVPMLSILKRHHGSLEEAELLLIAYQTSALQYLHSLAKAGDGTITGPSLSIHPKIGWKVIGHTWSFYCAWKQVVQEKAVLCCHFRSSALFAVMSFHRAIGWYKSCCWPNYRNTVMAASSASASAPETADLPKGPRVGDASISLRISGIC